MSDLEFFDTISYINMIANAQLNDWNRNRILHQQSSRSLQSLARMRAKAMKQNQKAMSPAQYREFHLSVKTSPLNHLIIVNLLV